ncbi:hypothetical protein MTO96_016650 [Rhipicephalus appendiculatus]
MKTWMFEKDGGIQNHRHRELLLSDPDEYRRLLRLSCEQFTQLLALVGPMIDRQDTAVRRSISPATRLQVILRYLATGNGVPKNSSMAFYWFRKSANQGHAHSAYNLAVGHMQGFPTDVQKGEAKKLIKYAADNGVHEAHLVYHEACRAGKCDH